VDVNANVGHAWIGFVDKTDGTVISGGLRPTVPLEDLQRRDGECPGVVGDDAKTEFTVARAFAIDEQVYIRTRDRVVAIRDRVGEWRDRTLTYDIIDYNCCSFAVEIIRSAGIAFEPGQESRADFGVVEDDQRPNYRPGGVADAIRNHKDGTLFGK